MSQQIQFKRLSLLNVVSKDAEPDDDAKFQKAAYESSKYFPDSHYLAVSKQEKTGILESCHVFKQEDLSCFDKQKGNALAIKNAVKNAYIKSLQLINEYQDNKYTIDDLLTVVGMVASIMSVLGIAMQIHNPQGSTFYIYATVIITTLSMLLVVLLISLAIFLRMRSSKSFKLNRNSISERL